MKLLLVCALVVTLKLVNCWPNLLLYTKTNMEGVNLESKRLKGTTFNSSLSTVFYVHGFERNVNHKTSLAIRDKLIEKTDSNVIMVEWSKTSPSSENGTIDLMRMLIYSIEFPHALVSVKRTADHIANYIKASQIDPENVHCIGFSLGAHICGFVGKQVKNLGRITGLDPASFPFRALGSKHRLDKSDAKFVDCIMTSSLFGINMPICHKNFFPNGGLTQTACPKDFELKDGLNTCNHEIAISYFVESIDNSCRFESTLCQSYDKFSEGECKCVGDDCDNMGFHTLKSVVKEGSFFLDTDGFPPYCRRNETILS